MQIQSQTFRKLSFPAVITCFAVFSGCTSDQEVGLQSGSESTGGVGFLEPRVRQPSFVVTRLVPDDSTVFAGNRIFYRWRDMPVGLPEDERLSSNRAVYDENGDGWLIASERMGLGNPVDYFLTAAIPFGMTTTLLREFNDSVRERTRHLWVLELPTMVDGEFAIEIRVPDTEIDPERNGCVVVSDACVRDFSACTVAELDAECQHSFVDLSWPSTRVSFTIDDMRAIERVTSINPDPVRGGYPTEMTLPVIQLTLSVEHILSAELIENTILVEHPEYSTSPALCAERLYSRGVPWDELPWECREYAEQGLIETEEEYRERTFDPYGDRDFAPGED